MCKTFELNVETQHYIGPTIDLPQIEPELVSSALAETPRLLEFRANDNRFKQ